VRAIVPVKTIAEVRAIRPVDIIVAVRAVPVVKTILPVRAGSAVKNKADVRAIPHVKIIDETRAKLAGQSTRRKGGNSRSGKDRIMSTLLRTSQVAEALGVSKSTVGRWAQDGKIPSLRQFGGQRRFDPRIVARIRQRWAEGSTDISELTTELFNLRDELAKEEGEPKSEIQSGLLPG
jgi:excisionase family DNA binding protein